jgi:hypothetical protein
MAKTIMDRVKADVEKAKLERRKAKLEEDYRQYINEAAKASSEHERETYEVLAMQTLKQLEDLTNKKK